MFSNIPMRSINNVLMGEKRNGGLGGVDQYKKGLGALGKELGLFKNRGGSLHGLVVKSPPMKTRLQKEYAAPPEKDVDKPHKASDWVKKAAKPRKHKKKAVEEAEAEAKLDKHTTNPIAKEARKGGAIADATAAIVGGEEGHAAKAEAGHEAKAEAGHEAKAEHVHSEAQAQAEHKHSEAQTHDDGSQELSKKEKERLHNEVLQLREALERAHSLVGKRAQEHDVLTSGIHAEHKAASEASRIAYGELSAAYEKHRREAGRRADEQEARHAEAIRALKQAHGEAYSRKHQEIEALQARHAAEAGKVRERVAELEAKAAKGLGQAGGSWSLFGGGSKVSPMMYEMATNTTPQKAGRSVSTSPLKEAGQQAVAGSNQSQGGGGSAAAAAAAAAKQPQKHEGQVDNDEKAKAIADALLTEGRFLKAGYRITAGGHYQNIKKGTRTSKDLATEKLALT